MPLPVGVRIHAGGDRRITGQGEGERPGDSPLTSDHIANDKNQGLMDTKFKFY